MRYDVLEKVERFVIDEIKPNYSEVARQFEVDTFKRQENKLVLELNHNQFRYDQLSELNELKQTDPNFLQLVNLVEQDQKVVLTYALPDKVKPLIRIILHGFFGPLYKVLHVDFKSENY